MRAYDAITEAQKTSKTKVAGQHYYFESEIKRKITECY